MNDLARLALPNVDENDSVRAGEQLKAYPGHNRPSSILPGQMSFRVRAAEPCGFRAPLYRFLVPRGSRWIALLERDRCGRGFQKVDAPPARDRLFAAMVGIRRDVPASIEKGTDLQTPEVT